MSKTQSPGYQAMIMLKKNLRLGQSKHKAKLEAIAKAEEETGKKVSTKSIRLEGIYSTSTFKNYVFSARAFGKWAKKNMAKSY
ncbi:MAG: hypothetical protein IJ561_06545 [Ruminococcus sp.]|nr:hypothetical protein [Ruminococcus sp.]